MIHTLVRATPFRTSSQTANNHCDTCGWSSDDCNVVVKLGWSLENFHAVCHGRHQQSTKKKRFGKLRTTCSILCDFDNSLTTSRERQNNSSSVGYFSSTGALAARSSSRRQTNGTQRHAPAGNGMHQLATAGNGKQGHDRACISRHPSASNGLQRLATTCSIKRQLATACYGLQRMQRHAKAYHGIATICDAMQQYARAHVGGWAGMSPVSTVLEKGGRVVPLHKSLY